METSKPVNPNSKVEFWDNFSARYKSSAEEVNTYQGSSTCFAMVNNCQPGHRIIDVGCGTGLGSQIFASVFLQEKGVLVVTDFSPEMVKNMKARMEGSCFAQAKGNKVIVDAETDYTQPDSKIDIDSIVATAEGNRLVYGCRASGVALPFPDAWFDGYVSSLVIQLISDPVAMLKEAYRVLKPGSRACFTAWGRRERSLVFTVRGTALKNLGIEQPVPSISNFDRCESIEQTKQWVLETGFTRVKTWLQAANAPYFDGETFVHCMGGFNPDVSQLSDDDRKLRAEMIRVYDELSGTGTTDLCSMELCVILAFKD